MNIWIGVIFVIVGMALGAFIVLGWLVSQWASRIRGATEMTPRELGAIQGCRDNPGSQRKGGKYAR